MSRRHRAAKREVLPDPKYGNKELTQFMNGIMKQGKKSVAERIVYSALDIFSKKSGEEPLKGFLEALENVKPSLEVRSRRVGGATYQIPMDVRPERRLALGIRWIRDAARKRSEKTMEERLAAELIDAKANRGAAVKKREDTHKMAEANKAFAHFKW